MAYSYVGKQATHWALLLGSAFFPVAVSAAGTNTLAVHAPSVSPPALMLAKHWRAGLGFVTYRYRDRTPTGLPRFASFLRVREAE